MGSISRRPERRRAYVTDEHWRNPVEVPEEIHRLLDLAKKSGASMVVEIGVDRGTVRSMSVKNINAVHLMRALDGLDAESPAVSAPVPDAVASRG